MAQNGVMGTLVANRGLLYHDCGTFDLTIDIFVADGSCDEIRKQRSMALNGSNGVLSEGCMA